jgi:hypothetical protein
MRKLLGFAALLLFASLQACDDDWEFWECERPSGEWISRSYGLAPIDRLVLQLDAEVYITQGPEQRVRLEGPANVVEAIDLGVRNSTWFIEPETCFRGRSDLKVYLTLPTLRAVTVASSGRVEALEPFQVDILDVKMAGSGSIRLDVDADRVFSILEGSGHIALSGQADRHVVHSSGSGDLQAFGMESREASASLSGSGNVHVRVSSQLDASLSGSGSLYYKGQPDLSVASSGSGRVIDSN